MAPVVPQLSWSHYLKLLSIKNVNAINYYINQCIIHNYSKRELESIIKNKEYGRLSDSTKEKIINK